MSFHVEEKKYREIADDYKRLSVNAYPYQRPELMLNSANSLTLRLLYHTPVRYFAVYEEHDGKREIILIAPLRICISEAEVVGSWEGFNMTDFVYSIENADLLSEALLELLRYLDVHIFPGRDFFLDWMYLYENALSWKAIQSLVKKGSAVFRDPVVTIANVEIPLRGGYDAYFAALSKHARQNIRTAYNRIRRDDRELLVHFYRPAINKEDKRAAKKAFFKYSDLYIRRQADRYNHKDFHSFVNNVRMKYSGSGWRTASAPMTLLADITLDGKLAAYAKCYLDLAHRKATVPALAIDADWKFYSPGIVLVNELVKHMLELGDIDYLSMGRGEEPYKYEMGGEQYKTFLFKLSLAP